MSITTISLLRSSTEPMAVGYSPPASIGMHSRFQPRVAAQFPQHVFGQHVFREFCGAEKRSLLSRSVTRAWQVAATNFATPEPDSSEEAPLHDKTEHDDQGGGEE